MSSLDRHCTLFLANPSYCESVFAIAGLLQDLENVSTIEGFKRDPYLQSFNENDYVSKQRNTREKAKSKMEKLMEAIIAQVEKKRCYNSDYYNNK